MKDSATLHQPPSPSHLWLWRKRFLFFFSCPFLLLLFFSSLLHTSPCPSSFSPLLHFHTPPPPSPPPPFHGNLLSLPHSWNSLPFPPTRTPPLLPLRIALFVKKWPSGLALGGLETHSLTLHRLLADRGHSVHVFTVSADAVLPRHDDEDRHHRDLHFHFTPPNAGGKLDFAQAWERFVQENQSRPFDVVHTESVALPFWKARNLSNVVVSWHGIAYEIIHSDIVRDLNRRADEPRAGELSERVRRVIEEIKFFPNYRHHVATSDYVGDVLRTVYQIPLENVHIILNGVDEHNFLPDSAKGTAFRSVLGVPKDARLVFGVSGRLVKDKGHPLLFEAFVQILKNYTDVYLLVAGEGPWGSRYKELAPNVKVLGPLASWQLGEFYNALDVFVNPTLRSQGLDHTLLEAMLCGKPLLATHFSSITRSVIVHKELGYTFSPNVQSLVRALSLTIQDSKKTLARKGQLCYERASFLFTATKMASAYERLFLCMINASFCDYPLPSDLAVG